jgi:hypothetical protein
MLDLGILHFPVNTSGKNLELKNFLGLIIMKFKRFKPDIQV